MKKGQWCPQFHRVYAHVQTTSGFPVLMTCSCFAEKSVLGRVTLTTPLTQRPVPAVEPTEDSHGELIKKVADVFVVSQTVQKTVRDSKGRAVHRQDRRLTSCNTPSTNHPDDTATVRACILID